MNTELTVFLKRSLGMALLSLLAACGSDGGGSDESSAPSKTPPGNSDNTQVEAYPSVKYLYYFGVDHSDAANPLTRVYQVAIGGTGSPVQVERENPTNLLRPLVSPKSSNQTRSYNILTESNRFWYLSPEDQSIHALSSFASSYCYGHTFYEGVTRASSGILLATPGSDSDCNTPTDNLYWRIRLSDSATDLPEAVSRPVAEGKAILDSNLTLQGYLFVDPDTQAAGLFDAQGNSLRSLGSVTVTQYLSVSDEQFQQYLVVLDNSVWLLDPQTLNMNEVTGLGVLASTPTEASATFDSQFVYLIDGTKVHAINRDTATLAWTKDLAPSSPQFAPLSSVTDGYVVVMATNGSDSDLLAISKSDQTIKTVDTEPSVFFYASGSYLYFSHRNSGAVTLEDGYQAFIWKEDSATHLFDETFHVYSLASWRFYRDYGQGGNRDRALLYQTTAKSSGSAIESADTENSDFFNSPILYRFNVDSPDDSGVDLGDAQSISVVIGTISGLVRIMEVGNAESSNLMFTTLTYGLDLADLYLWSFGRSPQKAATGSNIDEKLAL